MADFYMDGARMLKEQYPDYKNWESEEDFRKLMEEDFAALSWLYVVVGNAGSGIVEARIALAFLDDPANGSWKDMYDQYAPGLRALYPEYEKELDRRNGVVGSSVGGAGGGMASIDSEATDAAMHLASTDTRFDGQISDIVSTVIGKAKETVTARA